jgi:hypothetical protein
MFNLAAIIAGAVNGAIEQVIPPVARDVVKTIKTAQDASPMAPPIAPPVTLDADAIAAQVIEKVLSQPEVAKLSTPVAWYQSHAIWGALVAGLAPLLGLLGYALSPEDAQTLVTGLVAVSSGVGMVISIYGRITTTRPIKGT